MLLNILVKKLPSKIVIERACTCAKRFHCVFVFEMFPEALMIGIGYVGHFIISNKQCFTYFSACPHIHRGHWHTH